MRFSITRVHRTLYTVEADDKIVGELSFERGAWGSTTPRFGSIYPVTRRMNFGNL